jgi:uridine kinase
MAATLTRNIRRCARYVHGQPIYFEAARPWERATFVIDNSDFGAPRVTRPSSVPTDH